jgi:hypothetical protein
MWPQYSIVRWRLVGGLSGSRSFGWSAERLVVLFIGWPFVWFIGWSIGWSVVVIRTNNFSFHYKSQIVTTGFKLLLVMEIFSKLQQCLLWHSSSMQQGAACYMFISAPATPPYCQRTAKRWVRRSDVSITEYFWTGLKSKTCHACLRIDVKVSN